MNGDRPGLPRAWRAGGDTHTHTHTRTHAHAHTPSWTARKQSLFPRFQTDPATKPSPALNQPCRGSEPLKDRPGAVLERSPISPCPKCWRWLQPLQTHRRGQARTRAHPQNSDSHHHCHFYSLPPTGRSPCAKRSARALGLLNSNADDPAGTLTHAHTHTRTRGSSTQIPASPRGRTPTLPQAPGESGRKSARVLPRAPPAAPRAAPRPVPPPRPRSAPSARSAEPAPRPVRGRSYRRPLSSRRRGPAPVRPPPSEGRPRRPRGHSPGCRARTAGERAAKPGSVEPGPRRGLTPDPGRPRSPVLRVFRPTAEEGRRWALGLPGDPAGEGSRRGRRRGRIRRRRARGGDSRAGAEPRACPPPAWSRAPVLSQSPGPGARSPRPCPRARSSGQSPASPPEGSPPARGECRFPLGSPRGIPAPAVPVPSPRHNLSTFPRGHPGSPFGHQRLSRGGSLGRSWKNLWRTVVIWSLGTQAPKSDKADLRGSRSGAQASQRLHSKGPGVPAPADPAEPCGGARRRGARRTRLPLSFSRLQRTRSSSGGQREPQRAARPAAHQGA